MDATSSNTSYANLISALQELSTLWRGEGGGDKGGAVVRALASHQCGPDSNPGVDAIWGLSFVVGFLLCFETYFSGYSGPPPPLLKNQH